MASCNIRARKTRSGSSRFDVRYRRAGRGTRTEHAGVFKTMKEAKLRQALVLSWLAAGRNPRHELEAFATDPVPQTFEDLATAWLASRHGLTDSTRNTYEGYLKLIGREFKSIDANRIQPLDVSRWIGRLVEQGRSPGTIKGYVRTLRMVMDGLPENPARHRMVELPRVRRVEPEPPSAEDVLTLLRAIPEKWVVAVAFMEQTGCRVSEAIGVADRDIEDGRVRFRADESKGEVSRWVDCPQWLLDLMPLRGIDRTSLGNTMRRVCISQGIANIHPHLLRHRRATLWHQSGLVAVELAYRLGHAKASMATDTYSHVRSLHEIDPSVLQVLVEERLHVRASDEQPSHPGDLLGGDLLDDPFGDRALDSHFLLDASGVY